MTARRRDSVKARRICFETHKWKDHLGRWRLTCHLNKCAIDPARDKWRADHIRRWAQDGEDTPENLWPICKHCDQTEKAPEDTSEIAKGKRVYERHYGIRRPEGFYKPEGARFDWKKRRYVRPTEAES